MPHIIVNAVLFQVLWFTAILTGWMWALIPLVALVTHFLMVVKAARVRLACMTLVILGLIADALLSYSGIYQFNQNNLMLFGVIPMWLSYMWIGFSLSLPLSLAWLFRAPLVLILFFSVGGPMSYVAGRELGALQFANEDIWALVLTWFCVGCIAFLGHKVGVQKPEKIAEPCVP